MSPNTHRCRKKTARTVQADVPSTAPFHDRLWHLCGASLREDKANYFCSAKTKRDSTLCCISVRRQSINKLYNYGLILRQTTAVSAFALLRAQIPPRSLSGRRWEQEDERYSVLLGRWQEKWQHTRRAYGLGVCTRANARALPANLFEKWQKFHTVITQLTAVIWLFLISASRRQMRACAHARCTHARTHVHCSPYPADKSTKIISTYRTSGVLTKQSVFLVVMKLQQQELINTNTGMLETKINARMGVILASKTVSSLLSREPDAPPLLHYGAFLT